MSRGKYLSLEEARNEGKVDRFVKENPSEAPKRDFDQLLEKMCKAKKPSKDDQT